MYFFIHYLSSSQFTFFPSVCLCLCLLACSSIFHSLSLSFSLLPNHPLFLFLLFLLPLRSSCLVHPLSPFLSHCSYFLPFSIIFKFIQLSSSKPFCFSFSPSLPLFLSLSLPFLFPLFLVLLSPYPYFFYSSPIYLYFSLSISLTNYFPSLSACFSSSLPPYSYFFLHSPYPYSNPSFPLSPFRYYSSVFLPFLPPKHYFFSPSLYLFS